jgi:hypothetical protein
MRRFKIIWHSSSSAPESCGYRVSIPNYEGGEVVAAEDYDALLTAIAQHREHKLAREGAQTSDWALWRTLPAPNE